MLEKSLLMVQDRLEEKHVSVTKHFVRKLPRVPMDLVRMMQVFTNLFLNAIQAVNRGGKMTVTTRLERNARGRSLQVTLADNGKGISPHNGHPSSSPSTQPGAMGPGSD